MEKSWNCVFEFIWEPWLTTGCLIMGEKSSLWHACKLFMILSLQLTSELEIVITLAATGHNKF